MVSKVSLSFALALVGCGAHDPRVFSLRAPVTRDPDLDDVALPCAGKPKCQPKSRESSFAWDAADNLVFRPGHDLLSAKRTGEALDVNSLDETPDTSWFVNRIGQNGMTPEQVFAGACPLGKQLDQDAGPGKWLIDHGKDNGANPGFRVKVDGEKYMLKTDAGQGERATAATAISTRLYYAAGYWAPCDAIVYFTKEMLELKPGLTIKANVGAEKKFDDKLLDDILKQAERRGDRYRAAASRWLPGEPLGPFTYGGKKKDDPNDVVAHEMRREVRGARLMAAWMNHFDSREQNSMMTWLPQKGMPPGYGHIRHWIIDIGDSFGSEWAVDGFSRQHGQAYIMDFRWMGEAFVELGIPQRPWDRATHRRGVEDFGYFSAEDFDPTEWKGEYPNPAFQAMTERDGAWMARIIARFTKAHVEAAVRAGDLTNPVHSAFLVDSLMRRRETILRRYFSKLSSIADVHVEHGRVCGLDLARSTGAFSKFAYVASIRRAGGEPAATWTTTKGTGEVCVSIPQRAPEGGPADDAVSRYVVVDVKNGVAPGPLRLHLYDLGPTRGLRLAGIERPD